MVISREFNVTACCSSKKAENHILFRSTGAYASGSSFR
ncbi:hypothetical protein GBAR_LOCUS27410 [Geodia barretti]|uniref:Uncharacterized protein n=1 Tax=Geodia barretti TaxID=519541 RepID=A0AA35TK60_GEOBA|nr:hypothetical protein GBAR_LOCUS27410 [Geodia barretti]